MELHRNLKPWPPGVSGNPNGRPVGSRSTFSAGFTRDLAEVWAEKGKASMLYTAEKCSSRPAALLAYHRGVTAGLTRHRGVILLPPEARRNDSPAYAADPAYPVAPAYLTAETRNVS